MYFEDETPPVGSVKNPFFIFDPLYNKSQARKAPTVTFLGLIFFNGSFQ